MQTSNGVKKIVLLVFVFLFLTVGQAQAAGLVPCEGTEESPCSICSFFKMISNAFNLAIKIVIVIATLMLVIGGGMLLFAGADPSMLTKAKSLIKSTVIGLVIIFTAFMIVGVILNAIGLANWTADFYKDWLKGNFFQIPGCESGTPNPSVSPTPPTTPTPTPPAGEEPIPPLPPTPPAFK